MTTTHQSPRISSTFSVPQSGLARIRPLWRVAVLTIATLLALLVAYGSPTGGSLLRWLSLTSLLLNGGLVAIAFREHRHRSRQERRNHLLHQLASRQRIKVETALEELRARKWLCDGTMNEVDLTGVDLKNLNFNGASLVSARLFRADLSGANLSEATFCGARLAEADLKLSNFFRSDLRGADLRLANLRRAYLRQADLSRIDLRLADLRQSELTKSILIEADLFKADLAGALLIKADLRGGNLAGANLHRADLRGADLRYARFERANLSGANLEGARLDGALLTHSQLQRAASLRGAILPNGRLFSPAALEPTMPHQAQKLEKPETETADRKAAALLSA